MYIYIQISISRLTRYIYICIYLSIYLYGISIYTYTYGEVHIIYKHLRRLSGELRLALQCGHRALDIDIHGRAHRESAAELDGTGA